MNQSSVSDDGGSGVVIRNNLAGAATIDNLVSNNAAANAVLIEDSGGSYTFSNSNPQVNGRYCNCQLGRCDIICSTRRTH
jgi:hypothetical protein